MQFLFGEYWDMPPLISSETENIYYNDGTILFGAQLVEAFDENIFQTFVQTSFVKYLSVIECCAIKMLES